MSPTAKTIRNIALSRIPLMQQFIMQEVESSSYSCSALPQYYICKLVQYNKAYNIVKHEKHCEIW